MAARCVADTRYGVCDAPKNHSVHVLALGVAGAHPYQDPTRSGLKAKSSGRVEYERSQEHKEAYEGLEGVCMAEAAGAPGACRGGLSPHHTAPAGRFGGRKAAERAGPVVTLCVWHNDWVSGDGQAWARAHTFWRDGHEHPFLLSPRDADKDGG